MAKGPIQTTGDLRQKAIIADDQITMAVKAYLANSKDVSFKFASGHTLDLGAPVRNYPPAKSALAGHIISNTYRRTMVRTAVILAVPTSK